MFKNLRNISGSARLSGWGVTENRIQSTSDVLLSAQVGIRDYEACKSEFEGIGHVTGNMIFAGGYEDACKGDSGGPLTCWKGQERYLCGIVSWGTDCAHKDNKYYPSVYTDVRKYGRWVAAQLESWGEVKGKFMNKC